jgi:hypothetical protein
MHAFPLHGRALASWSRLLVLALVLGTSPSLPGSSVRAAAAPLGLRWTLAPVSGPGAETIQVSSIDPCPAPPAGAVTETATVRVQPPVIPLLPSTTSTSPGVIYRPPPAPVPDTAPVTIPLNADGTWSGRISIPAQPSGPVWLEASCTALPANSEYAGYIGQPFVESTAGRGYWLAESPGQPADAVGFGDAGDVGPYGSLGGATPSIKGGPLAITAFPPTGAGYWLAGGSNGGVLPDGDAPFLGDGEPLHLNKPVVGIAATPDGKGYWLASSDGGVFAFGRAAFLGSAAGSPLNGPIVGIAATPDGGGYWLAAADGGVFAYGDAGYYGSAVGTRLRRPVVGIAATPDGLGYRLAAADGGVFTFGDADFLGSAAGLWLNAPVVGLAGTADGQGYWLAAADGGVFSFGDAQFFGSGLGLAALSGPGPAIFAAIAATPVTVALTETVGAVPATPMLVAPAAS